MLPAIASNTSVNEVRASDRLYTASSVLTSATGRFGLTLATAFWISWRNPIDPARGVRMRYTGLRVAAPAAPGFSRSSGQ